MQLLGAQHGAVLGVRGAILGLPCCDPESSPGAGESLGCERSSLIRGASRGYGWPSLGQRG